jgi:hypothetical protein
MKTIKFIIIICCLFVMVSLTACSGGGSSADGSLSLVLTDATTNDYKAVYVTIEEVQVCTDDENEGDVNSWYTVAEPGGTYNLLELVNGVREQLGVTDLEAGHYTQMRLIIGTTADGGSNILDEVHPFANYIIDDENLCHELKIPSGIQTGIKLVSGFNIYENQTTELILDFDASRSVVKAGNSGKWLLKPTIKVIGTTVATISGTVIYYNDNLPLSGVLVSAQVYNYNSDGDEAIDEVIVQASTITNENGEYVLFVEPGVYNLVAYGEGYYPQCSWIEVIPNSEYVDNKLTLFSCDSAGELEGDVTVVEAPYVSMSIRQSTQCDEGIDTEIEIISLNIADGGHYSITLPVLPDDESYHVVAETEGYDTQGHTVDIAENTITTLDIIFEP